MSQQYETAGFFFSALCAFFCQGIAVFGALARGQENDLPLRDRFLQVAPKHWEEYVKRAKMLQGSFSFHLANSNGDTKVHNTYEMKMNGKEKLIKVSSEKMAKGKKDRQKVNVFGANTKYAFVLERKTDTEPWVVTQLVDLSRENLLPSIQQEFEMFERNIRELVSIQSVPLAKIVQQPEFRVVRCRRVVQGGEELVEITFVYPHSLTEISTVHGGKLLLDPQRFWCLQSYEVQEKFSGGQGTQKYQVLAWAETDGDLPVPKRIAKEGNYSGEGKSNKQVVHLEYDLSVPRQLPNSKEFSLSAFGLPEPPWLGRKELTPWYLWAALAGIICLSLAVLFRWLARRAKPTTGEPRS
jgi:hypothetical protein